MAKDQTTPDHPPQKGRIITALSIKRARRYADNKAPKPTGATPPTGTKPAPPPKVLSSAELVGKPTPQVTPQATPQVTPQVTPQAPPGPTLPGEEEGNLLEILFTRALRSRTDTKPADDPGIAMQQAITHLFQSAKPIKDIQDIVLPHISEMSSKIHLVRSTNAYHQIERGALYNLVRWTLEKLLWDDLINNKMTPAEKLCLLQLAIKEADKIQDFLGSYQHDLEKGGKGSSADVEAAREKSDRALTKAVDPTSKDLDGTSAVGRELARRVLDRAGKAAEALVEEALKKPA